MKLSNLLTYDLVDGYLVYDTKSKDFGIIKRQLTYEVSMLLASTFVREDGTIRKVHNRTAEYLKEREAAALNMWLRGEKGYLDTTDYTSDRLRLIDFSDTLNNYLEDFRNLFNKTHRTFKAMNHDYYIVK